MFSAAIPIAGVPVIASSTESGGRSVQRFVESGSVDWPEPLVNMPIYVVHSRADELIPIAPVEAAVAELEALGGTVEFMAIDAGIGHHETPKYVPFLAQVVPWVQEVWAGRR